MYTTVLNESEFSFLILGPGVRPGGRITHRYAPVPGGVSFYAETVDDFDVSLIGPLLNWVVGPMVFSCSTADHWIRHNIEETGRTRPWCPCCMRPPKRASYRNRPAR